MFLLDFFNENVFKSLQKISLDDLNHQELLANAIQMTAGNPKYCSSAGKWLSTRQIEYVKDTKQIIKLNIENKERAIINYKIAISKIDNNQIKNLLSSILNDEEEHLKMLKDIKM